MEGSLRQTRTARSVGKLPRPTPSRSALGSLRAGLSPCWRFPSAPMRGRGAIHSAGQSRRGVSCTVFRPVVVKVRKPMHLTLIPGGLERIRLPCRDVSSSPSSGPVYGGPSTGSILPPVECYKTRRQWSKQCRTRFLPSLLAPLVEEAASALPNGESIPVGPGGSDGDPKWMEPEFEPTRNVFMSLQYSGPTGRVRAAADRRNRLPPASSRPIPRARQPNRESARPCVRTVTRRRRPPSGSPSDPNDSTD